MDMLQKFMTPKQNLSRYLSLCQRRIRPGGLEALNLQRVAQSVERVLWEHQVGGSRPLTLIHRLVKRCKSNIPGYFGGKPYSSDGNLRAK